MLRTPNTPGSTKGGPLQIDDTITLSNGRQASVRELLLEKHPAAQTASSEALMDGESSPVHPVSFDSLCASLLKDTALHSHGSAGPSGLNSCSWRRMCSSFKGASANLCHAMAGLAKLLASKVVHPAGIAPLLSCRLVALDKQPGVRPIGVGEVLLRIIAKAILRVTKTDIQDACGHIQKCSGVSSGIEAAVHAMQALYDDDTTEGILLIDAANAFNTLNREAALHNVKHVCPPLATVLTNSYLSPGRLFVAGGGEIASSEGTTQGDPLSMAFYALTTVPLIQRLMKDHPAIRQIWYADDSGGAGRLLKLRAWLETVITLGKLYGYHVNVDKTVLLVKPGLVEKAQQIFQSTGVLIVAEGTRYLGSAIGEHQFGHLYLQQKVADWVEELDHLAEMASTEPQAAYAALSHGLRGRWNYILRTLRADPDDLVQMDSVLTKWVLHAITGHHTFVEDEISLLQLPARLGGIGFPSIKDIAVQEFDASKRITSAQVSEICLQQGHIPRDGPILPCSTLDSAASKTRRAIANERRKAATDKHRALLSESNCSQRHLELLSARGASAWLTVLPLKEHGFQLSKQEFWDALALRYNWQLSSIPVTCVCGKPFTADHAMVCAFGGFPTVRHNEVRDLTAELLTEVCHSVAVEPTLLPLSGEAFTGLSTNTSENARADVRAAGFWTRGEDSYFDVKVFHADAPSYKSKLPTSLFELHERRKRLEYEERIVNVDRGSFTPLVFTTTGAAGPMAERFLQRLAGKLTEKDGSKYSVTMAWLRCRLSFALLRGAILCVRGSRSHRQHPVHSKRELAVVESRMEVH